MHVSPRETYLLSRKSLVAGGSSSTGKGVAVSLKCTIKTKGTWLIISSLRSLLFARACRWLSRLDYLPTTGLHGIICSSGVALASYGLTGPLLLMLSNWRLRQHYDLVPRHCIWKYMIFWELSVGVIFTTPTFKSAWIKIPYIALQPTSKELLFQNFWVADSEFLPVLN